MPVQARIVGLESGATAFQGGALQGPLGSVAARQGEAGAEGAARLEPAAGIGVSLQAQPGRVAAGADLGQAVRLDAMSEAERRRLAAALQIVRGLSIGAASDGGDMSRAAIAWRIVQRATLSGSAGADGSRSIDVQALDRFGAGIDQEQDSLRQRFSVDVVPGLSIETSGPLDFERPAAGRPHRRQVAAALLARATPRPSTAPARAARTGSCPPPTADMTRSAPSRAARTRSKSARSASTTSAT